jgi:hypothetical protein
MTLQNRVMPDGSIVAIPARGTLTGNRGILHDAKGQLGTARWRHRHWISCELSFKGWRRPIMAPGHWTELFFLDEAVAIAAGHRPCALCRRSDYLAFRTAWTAAFDEVASADPMDRALHAARVVPGRGVLTKHEEDVANLPDGTFIRLGDKDHLVRGTRLLPFTPETYGLPVPRPASGPVTVLTSPPMVAVLAAGYRPRLHPSAAN